MKAVTANRLQDGRVVFLGADGALVERLADATLFDDAAADDALGYLNARPREVAGAYLIEVGDGHKPDGRARLRESIRANGPTIRFGADAEAIR